MSAHQQPLWLQNHLHRGNSICSPPPMLPYRVTHSPPKMPVASPGSYLGCCSSCSSKSNSAFDGGCSENTPAQVGTRGDKPTGPGCKSTQGHWVGFPVGSDTEASRDTEQGPSMVDTVLPLQHSFFCRLTEDKKSEKFFKVFYDRMKVAQQEIKATVTVNTSDLGNKKKDEEADRDAPARKKGEGTTPPPHGCTHIHPDTQKHTTETDIYNTPSYTRMHLLLVSTTWGPSSLGPQLPTNPFLGSLNMLQPLWVCMS